MNPYTTYSKPWGPITPRQYDYLKRKGFRPTRRLSKYAASQLITAVIYKENAVQRVERYLEIANSSISYWDNQIRDFKRSYRGRGLR